MSPLLFVCCGILYILGLLWIVLGIRFGHDRAENDSEIVFPTQAVNCLCDCMYAVVGLRTVLE